MFSKTAVTDPISSPRTSMAGSGPPPSPPCRPPTPAAPSTTGHTRAAWGSLSQTTGRRLSSTETRSPAWPSSTTTTETVSDRIFTFLNLHSLVTEIIQLLCGDFWVAGGGGRRWQDKTRQTEQIYLWRIKAGLFSFTPPTHSWQMSHLRHIYCHCFRNQVARCGLHPREAHHLRGCGRTPGLRQATIPSDQNSLKSLWWWKTQQSCQHRELLTDALQCILAHVSWVVTITLSNYLFIYLLT